MNTAMRLLTLLLLCLPLILSGCSSKPSGPAGVKIGKPYQVYGRWYTPEHDPTYDETGMASWYGPGFHGNKTSSGERFDQDELTAAHRTLPMPSLVRVTNLDNGQSAVIRINDRGPYHSNRIIDLSRASAERLGVIRTGTAQVRVQYLKAETEAYLHENNVPGKEKILLAAQQQAAPTASDMPQEKSQSVWGNIFGSAQAQEAPLPVMATSGVSSSDLPPLKPVYRTESNLDTPTSPMQPRREPVPEASPFRTPPGTVTSGMETHPSLNKAMEMVDEGVPPEQSPAPKNKVALSPLPETSASSSASGIFVQAGSFGVRENAERLQRQIASVGDVQVLETQAGNRALYRVRVGPLSSVEEAGDVLKRLEDLGVGNARMVRL